MNQGDNEELRSYANQVPAGDPRASHIAEEDIEMVDAILNIDYNDVIVDNIDTIVDLNGNESE